MFCSNCGKELTKGEKFCSKCGTPATGAEQNSAPVAASGAAAAPVAKTETKPEVKAAPEKKEKKETKEKKKGSFKAKAILFGILAVGVVVLICMYKPTVRLDRYIDVEFTGYDTVGSASYTIDYASLREDYADKIKINKSALKKELKQELGELYSKEFVENMIDNYLGDPMSMFTSEVYGSLDTYSGLSNGDVVTFTWDIDKESMEKIFNCKVKCNGKEFKVKGLEDIEQFDPFQSVTVEYYGMAPHASASVNRDYSSDMSNYLYFSLDKSDSLKNGDVVTVKAEISIDESRFAEMFGVLPSPKEKQYTVEGLSSYILNADEMPDDLVQKMQTQSEDIIKAYAANNWDEEVTLAECSYLGNYFLTRKDNNYSTDVRVYMVYKLVAQQEMETEDQGVIIEDTTCYYYVCFYNPMLEADGNGAVDITRYETPWDSFEVKTGYKIPNSWGSEYNYYYRGYESMAKLENAVVTKNLEYYNHQDNITEQ